MNQMLQKRNYSQLTAEKYLSIFTFPIQDYYKKASMDLDTHNWDTVVMEFIGNYRKNIGTANLHTDVLDTLKYFQ